MESTSAAICSAERFFVPLKTMCSMKWLMPVCSGCSCRLPRVSQTPTATLLTWGMASVTRVSPLSSTSFVMLMRAKGQVSTPRRRVGRTRVLSSDAGMDDRDYKRFVAINLPHARTLVQRLGRTLTALGALPEDAVGEGPLYDALCRLEAGLRDFDED